MKDSNDNSIKRIKILESVVEKRSGVIAEKDCALDAALFKNSKLQNLIIKDRSERVDNEKIINETKKLKENTKKIVTCSKEIQSQFESIENVKEEAEKKLTTIIIIN